ncbi:MAG: glycosyltransferase family 4 protein, partial [Chloroflexota bacterium]
MHLSLFFTLGVSLHTWADVGMLSREVAIYRRLVEAGWRVNFITYGDQGDLRYEPELHGIRVYCNRFGLPLRWYARWLHLVHWQALRQTSVIKTNQVHGADVALRAAQFWKKPLVARCGYVYSKNTILEHGAASLRAQQALALEQAVFSAADRCVVTTRAMADDIHRRIPRARVQVIPNYVDTDVFRPAPASKDIDVLFVGRVAEEKNIDILLPAAHQARANLAIVGQGRLMARYQSDFAELSDRVTWLGRVPNEQLPALMNRAKLFVLPSKYEGHPKTLLESMACGLPVIGTDVSGIRDVIQHEETGLLVPPDEQALADAIRRLLDDASLRQRLGAAARS